MRHRNPNLLLAATLALALATGCSKAPAPAAGAGGTQVHRDTPPHGGTPVALGDGQYHLELVLDAATGRFQAYVLDDEMEDFVRCAAPSITLAVTVNGSPRVLELAAVPNTETGETVGDTALYEGHAEWLRTTPRFDAVLKGITVRGTTFTGVKFNFPKGNDSG